MLLGQGSACPICAAKSRLIEKGEGFSGVFQAGNWFCQGAVGLEKALAEVKGAS